MTSTAAIAPAKLSIESLLGGRSVLHAKPRTALDWVAIIRRGISSAAVDAMTEALRVTQAEIATALGIPARTLARRRKEGTLNSEESAKLVRLARLVVRAGEIFGDRDAAETAGHRADCGRIASRGATENGAVTMGEWMV
jgi:putative toxin-antitoxin system antitoxin component (TIGR02293 family)